MLKTTPRRVAIFKAFGCESIIQESHGADSWDGYTRMSEYTDVEFTTLPDNVVVEGQLKAIDIKEAQIRAKFQEALDMLNNERSKLLALTHQE